MKFFVNKPLFGHDEDAPAYVDDKIIIICDGLGGSGQNTYSIDGVTRSSAYIGSRLVSNIARTYLSNNYDLFYENIENSGELIKLFKNYLITKLNEYVKVNNIKNIVKGKSMQTLPTTLVAILYKENVDHTDVLVISAGDSRAFVITSEFGLQQLSKDDVIEDTDEYEKTATMSNNISQDREFHLNYRYYKLPNQCILFACSDGCFDYVVTPMEFEYRIVYSICKCDNILENNSFGDYYGNMLEKSGLKDDCTVAGKFIGYDNLTQMKKNYLNRALILKSQYRVPYEEYEKKSILVKKELKDEILECEKKLKLIDDDIYKKLFNNLEKIYLHDVNLLSKDEPIEIFGSISKKINIGIYNDFLQKIKKYETDIESSINSINIEIEELKNKMSEIYRKILIKKYEKSLSKEPNLFTFFQRDKRKNVIEKNKLIDDYDLLKERFTIELKNFEESVRKLKEYINDLGNTKVQDLIDSFDKDLFNQICSSVPFLINSLREIQKEVSIIKDKIEMLFNEEVDVNKEFEMAFNNNFIGITFEYDNNLKDMKKEIIQKNKDIEIIVKNLSEYKINLFKQFFKDNYKTILETISNDEYLLNVLIGNLYKERNILLQNYEDIKNRYNEFDELKYELWNNYKVLYQLYKNLEGGKV